MKFFHERLYAFLRLDAPKTFHRSHAYLPVRIVERTDGESGPGCGPEVTDDLDDGLFQVRLGAIEHTDQSALAGGITK